jgi:hypothetical protein
MNVVGVFGAIFVINVHTILDFINNFSYNIIAPERSGGNGDEFERWLLSDAWMYPPFVHPH